MQSTFYIFYTVYISGHKIKYEISKSTSSKHISITTHLPQYFAIAANLTHNTQTPKQTIYLINWAIKFENDYNNLANEVLRRMSKFKETQKGLFIVLISFE